MNKLPTVCFLTGTLNAFAGAERMTAVIANALAERGYRVFVLSLWDRASVFTLHPALRHHALFDQRPSFKREYFSTVLGVRRFLREHQIDVLVEVDTMLTLFTVPATLGMRVRRIAWEHCHFDEDLGRRSRRVARWLAARCNAAVIVLTERDRNRWVEEFGSRCMVSAVPNPLPFAFPDAPSACQEHTVLAVGRLVPAKGFDLLLHAWRMVVAAHPAWSLRIVGEGEERPALEDLVARLGLGESVQMPGASTDIARHYRQASAFCLSSHYEGFALVLVEAMSFGLPIVSTDCETGPRELIDHDRNGILVPAADPVQLAAALCRVIADEGLRLRLGTEARAVARQFGLAPIIAQWQALLIGS